MRTLLAILTAGSLVARIAENTSSLLQHVKFQSSNFETILTWESGPEEAPDTVYSVEYKTYGGSAWLAKKGCQRITQKSCNLTVEINNVTDEYYAQVTALNTGSQTATKMTDRFNLRQHTILKPPKVTCIPRVRSIQMVIHPTFTPIHSEEDGHQLTLEDIFVDLSYCLELRVNHSYQMHREGKQKEHEFFGLTPDTEFNGTIKISVPLWAKESAPYVCQVKTLPDRTWTFPFSGVVLFSMGFLVAGLCYLSYRYITKPPPPPSSLNVQHLLTSPSLRVIQEHVLIPAFVEMGSPTPPVQYSQIKVSGPIEPPRAPALHSLPETVYLEQQDASGLQPPTVPPPQMTAPLSYAPQAATEVKPSAYTPQTTPKAEPLRYAPQAASEAQLLSCSPQVPAASWPSSYGIFMEGSGKDSCPGTPQGPKYLQPDGQFQKEASSGCCSPSGLSLKGVASSAMEEPPRGIYTDPNVLPRGEPGTSGYLKDQLPLLSSVQIEGHPGSLPLHTPSLKCPPTDQGPPPWGLLETLVCSEDEDAVSEAEAKSQASRPEPQAELDTLFKDLALTVQWES
ncbi:interleukin-22 receptor subunit alpha-1 [Sorex araneus]|uniref:interleukin-22 receptor subunit alpha-1 n=1 Tax=Sorex araneus TaxID=42254 RepID=UPI00033172CB|nr:interleukin-22 receptor subunit alpha-1 [Sorex araneus]